MCARAESESFEHEEEVNLPGLRRFDQAKRDSHRVVAMVQAAPFDGPVNIDAGTLALGIGSDTTDSNAGNFTLADGTTFAIGVGGFGTHVFGGTVTDGANSATVTNASGNLVTFNGAYSVETTSNAGNLAWNGTTTPARRQYV